MITTIINKNDDETNYQPIQQKETNKIEFYKCYHSSISMIFKASMTH